LITNFEMTNVAGFILFKSHCDWRISKWFKEWFSANSIFANIITGLTQPIFNQVRTKFEVANQEKAYLQFEQSLLTAGKEVSDALAQYNNETYKITISEAGRCT
jgi:outer membrane protein TolC